MQPFAWCERNHQNGFWYQRPKWSLMFPGKSRIVQYFLSFFEIQISFCSSRCKNKKGELFHILWMRNCILSCLRGLQQLWAFMNSFDIRAVRFEFQHKFFPPWHYYWKLLSVHCDRKLIIILDIWWIAFIKGPFFFISCWPIKYPSLPPPKKNFPKTRKEFLSSLVNPPLGVCSWDQVPKKKHWRASTDLSLLLGLPCFWPGKVRKCRKDSPLEPLDKTVRLIQSTVSYFITMKHSTYAWKGESLWEKYFYNSCLHSEKGIVCCVGWKRSPPPAGV